MQTFHYKAMRGAGERFEGSIEAADRFAVYDEVRKQGGTVLSIKEDSKGIQLQGLFGRLNALLSTVKLSERIALARNLAAMIEAGLPLARAFSVMERQTKNPKMRHVLSSVGEHIKRGEPLNEALRKFPKVFSPLMVSMVKAGEESGNLAGTLRNVSLQMDRAYQLKKKIRGALIYPGIVITAMVLVAVLMLIFIVPTLESTFSEFGAELPASTRSIIAVSNFLVDNTILAIVLFLMATVALSAALRTKRGKRVFDFSILHFPVIGSIVKETNSARTARTLSSLLSSGVEVISALSITTEVLQNSYYKEVLTQAQERVQKGEAISAIFAEHEKIYPVLVAEMVSVGEETGKLSDMLLQLAEFYEEEVAQKTKDLSTIVEPLLMIVVGIGVGFFAISMISPIYSLSSAI